MKPRSPAAARTETEPEIEREIAAFRRFNRFYTRILGLLDEGLLASGYSLAEARVLFELATRGRSCAMEIAGELNLDPGYLSRIVKKFEKAGLLARARKSADARQALLQLTRRGKAAFADLNRRSAVQARELLEQISPAKRTELMRSMRAMEATLRRDAERGAPFVLRPHRPGDMGWVVSRQSVLYAQEYGWDSTYEALASRVVADFIDHFDARRERCWIAERDGEPLGAIFLVRHPEQPETARLRLLHVELAARGKGLGAALVHECVEFARAAGYKRITLWTQSILHAAHRLYEEAGFKLVAEEPHHSFGVDLVGQTWELVLKK
jgi:DNA-binding MarR family transcriptional regulator/GNAT superfamily N-acetyltransferase